MFGGIENLLRKIYLAVMVAWRWLFRRRLTEEQSLRKAEEEARHAVEDEARRVAEENARRQAEEEARRKAEADARRAAEEARRVAEENARRQTEEETRHKAEADAQRVAEEARRLAEENARRKAEAEAQRAAEEEARRAAEERAQCPKQTVGKAEPATPLPNDEGELEDREGPEPPLPENEPLPKPRSFIEPKPPPITKVRTKKQRKSDSKPTDVMDANLPIRLQLVFGRGGIVKSLALVPERREEMPANIEATTTHGRLPLSEWSADSYEPVPVSDVPSALSEGVVFQARCGGQRWLWELSKREIYVLAAGELAGWLTRRRDQRLWLNTLHVVLAKDSLRDQVLAALSEAGCATPEVSDSTTPGVPPGWILLRDVKPTRAVPMREERDPLNVLCPAHEIETLFLGGIKLDRRLWLAGFPPRIRFAGELGNDFQVLIDGQPAQLARDGAFEALGWDAEGEHRLWFGGRAETYSLRTMEEGWEHWPTHDFGTGAAICGASTQQIGGARWHQIRIPARNPLLVGARPGEIFYCQARHDVRSETILALVPFAPVWALPWDPVHADKRSARVLQLDLREPDCSDDQCNRKRDADRAFRRWIAAINDAGRKQLALAVEGEDAKALWRRYRVMAKRLWRRTR